MHLREQKDRGTQEKMKEAGGNAFIQGSVVLSKCWDFMLSAVESLEAFWKENDMIHLHSKRVVLAAT